MKRIYLIFVAILTAVQMNLFAQDEGGVSIGKGNQDADASAILELFSKSKGLLVPRMTSNEREAIASPAEGLLVYDTDKGTFFFWSGASWVKGTKSTVGSTTPATASDGDFFYNQSQSVLYIYTGGEWVSAGAGSQTLELDGSTLTISGGNAVDLSSLLISGEASEISVIPSGELTSTNVQAALEELQSEINSGGTGNGSGDMLMSTYDADGNNRVDDADKVNGYTVNSSVPYSADFTDNQTLIISGNQLTISGGNTVTLPTGNGNGDMLQSVYDTNGNSIVDNADKVNGLTVQTAVPSGAVFTDEQTLSDVLTSGSSAGNSRITNLGTPTATSDAATKGYVDNNISGLESQANKNMSGGYVGLGANGKIDPSYLPSGINLGSVYAVADQAAQDGILSPVSGDIAIRADESKTYVYDGSNWVELQIPTGTVSSVNGHTGTVELSKTDIELGNVNNTSDVNKPVSNAMQSALDLKANSSDLGTAAGKDAGTGAGNVLQLDEAGKLPALDGSLLTGLPSSPVTSVNSQTGDIILDKGDVGLENVNNTSDVNKPVSAATQTALDLKEDKTNKNVAGGYVGLEADGKINQNYLPAGVNLGTVYTVGSELAMDVLVASSGDVAIRTDESKSYVYDGSNWIELQNPTDAVTSVNGQTGVVSLTTAEVSSSSDKNYVTDAQLTILGNTSGTNSGDQDISGIETNASAIATNTTAIAGLGTAAGKDAGTGAGNVLQLDEAGKLPALDGSLLTGLSSSPIESVNGQTGVVELTTTDITESTDKNYVTDDQIALLEKTSGENTGDQDIGGITINAAAIAENTANIATNTTDIAANTANIATNTTAIDGLGTAAGEDIGTGPGNVVQLDAGSKLPAVDGSQLTNLPAAPVTSVSGQTGEVVLDKDDVGLNHVDNTSDLDKPISTATQAELDTKADKSNVLELDNTVAFSPDNDYEPATKKYVDDNIASAGGGDMLKTTYDTNDDNIVDEAATVSDNAITPLKLDLASGNSPANGYVLKYDGASSSFKWEIDASGMANPMNAAGDIIYSTDGSGTPTKLSVGSNGQVLTVAAGVPAWRDASGGDMLKATYDSDDDGIVTEAATVSDDAITSAKIADGTIIANDMADAAVTSAKIADGAIATADMANDAVTSAKIADGTIAPADLDLASGNTASDGYVLKYDNGSSSFKWDAASAGDMLKSDYDKIDIGSNNGSAVDFAEYAYEVMDNTITSVKIVDGTIATEDVANDAITSAKIADGTILVGDIADAAVTSAKINDGTIATIDIANDAITSAKIADGTIAAADIAKMGATDGQVLNWSNANNTWEPGTASAGTVTNVSVTENHGVSGTVDNTDPAVPAISLNLGDITPTSVAVNPGGASAHASAALDVASTEKGILIPRMTETERDAISSPATGLMIFQTDGTSGFYYYTGSAWSQVGRDIELNVTEEQTGNYTVKVDDDIILLNPASPSGLTVTFPTSGIPVGKKYYLNNLSGTNGIDMSPLPITSGARYINPTLGFFVMYVGNGNYITMSSY